MNKLSIKYVSAENFLCFKNKVEITFENKGNIVLIRGENLDTKLDDHAGRISSNGVGKSSIPEIIVYTLFGKTIKHPKKIGHSNVINNQSGEKLKTELHIDDLKIIRSRKPDSLRVWQNKNGEWDDITLGGMPATQKMIEDRIGLTYDAFVNLLILTDNNSGSFLECDTPTKRQIIENLLELEVYRNYSESAKKMKNQIKDDISQGTKILEYIYQELEKSKQVISKNQQEETQWKEKKKQELISFFSLLENYEAQLKTSDAGKLLEEYNSAQDKIKELNQKLTENESKTSSLISDLELKNKSKDELNSVLNESNQKLQELKLNYNELKNNLKYNFNIIQDLELQKCKYCGKYDDEKENNSKNFIKENTPKLEVLTEEIQKITNEIVENKAILNSLIQDVKSLENEILDFKNSIKKASSEIKSLSLIEKPNIDIKEKLLEEKINGIKDQIKSKKQEYEGESPFFKIIQDSIINKELKEKEVENKKQELNDLNQELPYYEFWVKAFGDSGIRKFIIDGIVPTLNSSISNWLQYLINGKITLLFDNELEETIHRNPVDGDPFVYHVMSGGERRRLNLAVSQAFAYIKMLNYNVCPSLLFLDEVTVNVDPVGVQGIYNMILELSKTRQVMITTHDHDLLELLNGCHSINLLKANGSTSIV